MRSHPIQGPPSLARMLRPSTVTEGTSGFTRTLAMDALRCVASDSAASSFVFTIPGAMKNPKTL